MLRALEPLAPAQAADFYSWLSLIFSYPVVVVLWRLRPFVETKSRPE
jgi:hypothetical protein